MSRTTRMSKALDGPDAADSANLSEAVEALLPSLDRFVNDRPGGTATAGAGWREILDEPLPERGVGTADVLALLSDVVIPNGIRLGSPGFSGWITTAPTALPAPATLGAIVAGGQRAWQHPFHFLEEVGLRWLKALFAIPQSYQGLFTSGGSVANLVGLGAARQRGIDPSQA